MVHVRGWAFPYKTKKTKMFITPPPPPNHPPWGVKQSKIENDMLKGVFFTSFLV